MSIRWPESYHKQYDAATPDRVLLGCTRAYTIAIAIDRTFEWCTSCTKVSCAKCHRRSKRVLNFKSCVYCRDTRDAFGQRCRAALTRKFKPYIRRIRDGTLTHHQMQQADKCFFGIRWIPHVTTCIHCN